ncbi:MAG TPA: Fe-S cluster assembly protein SufD [Candidatus Binatia bacterium]
MLTSESKEPYLAAFKQMRAAGAFSGPAWLEQLRQAGIASFDGLGFPTLKNEDWKYTNIEPIAAQSYVQPNGEVQSVGATDLLSRALVETDTPRLVFVNGVYLPALSSTADLPQGLRLGSLAEFIKRDDGLVADELGRHASAEGQHFVALNTAFLGDGAVVALAPGCRLERPIYLLFISTSTSRPVISHPRILLWLGAGSDAKIVESYLGVTGTAYFCNAVTELVGGADSVVEHFRLQQESDNGFHVGTFDASLARGCHLTAHSVTLSGALVRNNLRVLLNGEGAECALNGLYLADGKQHVDNYTLIEHVSPKATSVELYKGLLGGSAHGVFNGKIVVHKDAQKSDARQTNKNLLLSDNAVIDSKPQLEIYADDVKCSHGSTIGQLDADAIFYLRSRGLDTAAARSLLSFAFASDVVRRLGIENLRQRLDEYLVGRFGAWL